MEYKKQNIKKVSAVTPFIICQPGITSSLTIASPSDLYLNVVVRNPAYTTMDCNFCGHRNHKLRLSQRKFVCEKCCKEIPRDYNSAKVIFIRGKELASAEKTADTELFISASSIHEARSPIS